MSRAAWDARHQNLAGRKRPRTYEQTRRIELEIALATHRGESYRAMAKRLGCSHVHCWRVARRYRRGLIPMLPPDEQGLLALRDSLDAPAPPPCVPEQPFPREPLYFHDNTCARCHAPLYNRAKWLCDGCLQLWDHIMWRTGAESRAMGSDLSADEVAELWRLEPKAAAPAEPQPQHRASRPFQEAVELLNGTDRRPGSGRRTVSSVPPWLRPAPKLDWD